MKKRTMNAHPYHCEASCHHEGFTLVFYCDGDKLVKLHFQYWWLAYIARDLWKVVALQEKEIESMKNAMQKGDGNGR